MSKRYYLHGPHTEKWKERRKGDLDIVQFEYIKHAKINLKKSDNNISTSVMFVYYTVVPTLSRVVLIIILVDSRGGYFPTWRLPQMDQNR